MFAVVAGAGIGGLVAALCLQQRGWQVQLHERAQRLEETGAGLQLSPNACKVLRALGVLPQVQLHACKPQRLEMRLGRSGATVFSAGLAEQTQARWGAPYLHIHRADLVGVLAETLQQRAPGALCMESAVSGYRLNGELLEVEIGGRDQAADLLIAADGVHSGIRQQMLGLCPAQFTGNVAWRVTVPTAELGAAAPPANACIWVGRGRHAVTYRLRRGELVNLVSVVEQRQWSDESWTAQGSREQALQDFSGWHRSVRRVLELAPAHYKWALLAREALPRWTDGPAALLGDAAHPMLPFLAQGAAMAIEDAWVLAESLDSANSVAAGLDRYVRLRRPRCGRVQGEAAANARRFHLPELAYAPLRLYSALRPDWPLDRQDWLFGHDVCNLDRDPA